MVLGKKEVPGEYAERDEEAEEGAPKQAAGKAEPEKDEEPVAPGIPGFWLGAMRAHPLISEHVRSPPSLSHLLSYILADVTFLLDTSAGTH